MTLSTHSQTFTYWWFLFRLLPWAGELLDPFLALPQICPVSQGCVAPCRLGFTGSWVRWFPAGFVQWETDYGAGRSSGSSSHVFHHWPHRCRQAHQGPSLDDTTSHPGPLSPAARWLLGGVQLWGAPLTLATTSIDLRSEHAESFLFSRLDPNWHKGEFSEVELLHHKL